MCQDLDAARFAKSEGIPMDMSRNFADLWCARDWCRSNQKSLNWGSIFCGSKI